MKKKIKKRLFVKAISLFAMAFMMGIIPACTASSTSPLTETEETGPKFIAHKGYSSKYYENTEESFRAAAKLGFYGIETDIRKTSDNKFVCWHDADVYFADKPDEAVKISATKRSKLLSRPLKNSKTDQDAYLCTFETYLQACKEGNKVAVIELKDYFFFEDDIQKMLDIIDAEYDRKMVCFIGFRYENILLVRNADPSIPLQYLSQEKTYDPKFEDCLKDGISIDIRFDVDPPLLTEELVKTFHDAGLTVNVWTVNRGTDLQAVCQYDVDYITTDVFYEE